MKNGFGFSFFNENIYLHGVITWMCCTTRDGELEGEYQGWLLGATFLQETGGKFQCLSMIDITKNLLKAQDALRFLAHHPSLFFKSLNIFKSSLSLSAQSKILKPLEFYSSVNAIFCSRLFGLRLGLV
jgi:hypothetical protein